MFEYIEKVALIRNARQLFGSKWYTERVVSLVESQPVVDVAPVRRGRWLEADCFDIGFWQCSYCGFLSEAIAAPKLYKYCPNCGADMREVSNDD